MEAVVLNTCDIWKGNVSMFGVFTKRSQLNKAITALIKEKFAEINKDTPLSLPLTSWSITEMHDHIDYISLLQITLNERV